MDSLLREKLKEHGYTTKELKFFKQTGKYLFTIRKHQEPDKLSFIKGPWAENETEILKEMYQGHVHTGIIADRLGRMEASVKTKVAYLAKYFQELNSASFYKDPQALSPALEDSISHSRLMTIWAGLMAFSKTLEWDKTLSNLLSDSWLSLIAEHTPKRFKSMLASYQPPSIAPLGR